MISTGIAEDGVGAERQEAVGHVGGVDLRLLPAQVRTTPR